MIEDKTIYVEDLYSKNYTQAPTWVAQLAECLTLAQVMISPFVSMSPTLGSLLLACQQSLLRILCPPLSGPPPKINKY